MSETINISGATALVGARSTPTYPLWSDVYNLSFGVTGCSNSLFEAGGNLILWHDSALGPYDKALIQRRALVFDTTGKFPAGTIILSAAITIDVEYYSVVEQLFFPGVDVGGYLKFMRGTHLAETVGGYMACTEYRKMRDMDILCGSEMITPLDTERRIATVTLNEAGLATITNAGLTKFALRCGLDHAAGPFDGAGWGVFVRDILLRVVVSTETELLVQTLAASALATTSCTLNGQILQGTATKRGFDWGDASDNLTEEWYEEGEFFALPFSHDITGLTPGQALCHRAKAEE